MPSKVIVKNRELHDIVDSRDVIQYIMNMLESGEYDPRVDDLKVYTEEEWEDMRPKRKLSR